MVSTGNHPQMAARFRLVKYYYFYPDIWVTPWLFDIAMENGQKIQMLFPARNLHLWLGFSMAMLVVTRWYIYIYTHIYGQWD